MFKTVKYLYKRYIAPTPGTGAMLDTRSGEEKNKDFFTAEAYATANPVDWEAKPRNSWREFPEQDQGRSGSCVAQTIKKILGVQHYLDNDNFIRFSATDNYRRRSNRPRAGMIGVESFEIARKHGTTLEELVPSERMTDQQMDTAPVAAHHEKIGEVFKISGHIGIPNPRDIDAVASVIQTTGKPVMVWYYFTSREWSRETPVVRDNLSGARDARSLRHSVAAVDYTLVNGKKALIIEDSAHFGGRSRRIITEDWHQARCFFARYAMNFVYRDPQDEKSEPIKHRFTKDLHFIPLNNLGQISDPALHAEQKEDVVKLQDILKKEGSMPTNISSTGYYGSITARAVLDFQRKHSVAPESELASLRGRSVGPKTIQTLNRLYQK